jgi:NADH-quinone oxidoreductase subunit L
LEYIWLAPAFPLAGVLINGFLGWRLPKKAAGTIASLAILGSFVVSVLAFLHVRALAVEERTLSPLLYRWIEVGGIGDPWHLAVDVKFLIDPLSLVMMLVVSGVSFVIHVYSTGYMARDEGYARFFVYLNLFVFAMLLLVMAGNFLLLFIGWEGVGLCSYLLIGFWYERPTAAAAGKKAFIVNRVGDFGFLLGVMLVFLVFHTLDFEQVFRQAPHLTAGAAALIPWICGLLFVGATGKSAQIPLFVWLPDAMEGPTPVSALIHAATMVTAGVYMVARCHVLFNLAPQILEVVAIIGAATAFMAATIGITQHDIKRILAYSTISQLGYMFLGCGVAAYSAGIFHLMTHAFFKALLFLGAGSVMHAMGDRADMRVMGGLKESMPHTWRTMLIGTLAIAGIFPLAGFWSKDEILWRAFNHSVALWIVGAVTALVTAFYMGRLLYKTFYGESRVPQDVHPHEAPLSMTSVLWILAVLSIVGGFIGLPRVTGVANAFERWVGPVFEHGAEMHAAAGSATTEVSLMVLSFGIAVVGLFVIARWMYTKSPTAGTAVAQRTMPVYRVVFRKYYVDEIYEFVWVKWGGRFADFLWRGIDVVLIDGVLVNGAAWVTAFAAETVKLIQNGRVRSYATVFLFGVILVIAYCVWSRGM